MKIADDLHLCPEMQVNEIQCSIWISISVIVILRHIWQNYVGFGDLLGKKDAYHKERASH